MTLPDSYARLGLVAGAALWLIWLVCLACGSGNLDCNGQVIGTDHSAFHTAAVLLTEGRGESLFDYPALIEFQTRQDDLIGREEFLDPYRNPPFYALLYRPTAQLPYAVSYGLWAAAGLLVLAASLRLVHGRQFIKPLAWSLSFYPVFAAVSFGQNTLLSLGIFALTYHSIVSERRFLAGFVAGLLLYKPQLLLGLGVWWLIDARHYWPALIGMMVTGLMLAFLSWLVVPQETATWIRRLPDIAAYDAFEFFNLHNPRGFGDLLTGNRRVGQIVGLLGLGLAIAWLWRFQRRHHSDDRLIFVAAIFATLWGSPHTMIYEWALLVVPAIILWNTRPNQQLIWKWMFAVAWIALFVSTPLTKGQLALTHRLFGMGVAIQISVPILAWIGIRAERACR
ncbi:MAG TPA: glycosyltransferase family 87 protein [Gemmataceae bacterium]|jgi:hypothetical protein|nr:glycosyltransferase family 87 protein [Gemmataceae bacterium]